MKETGVGNCATDCQEQSPGLIRRIGETGFYRVDMMRVLFSTRTDSIWGGS
jgi:hypothetical protein